MLLVSPTFNRLGDERGDTPAALVREVRSIEISAFVGELPGRIDQWHKHSVAGAHIAVAWSKKRTLDCRLRVDCRNCHQLRANAPAAGRFTV